MSNHPSFADLDFGPHITVPGGIHATTFFPNGYGASVVRNAYSYGGDQGLYELAVLDGDAKTWSLTYKTPITEDVLGSLTPEDVTRVLREIAALPVRVAA